MKILLSASVLLCINCFSQKQVTIYHADAWQLQTIPGKIECEFYDRGGEGISYHDSDSINNGSGKLNPADGSYLNEFRMKEGVDISYTKSNNIDNNPFNKTTPLMNQLYVGWTQPGEWIKYTIVAKESGSYQVGLMYTANGDGAITLDLDDKQVTGVLKVQSTHNDADTVAWRQWHHWNKLDSLTTLNITKGKHVLTLHVAEHGNMNFDYLEFSKQ
jgi:hypothetical protein